MSRSGIALGVGLALTLSLLLAVIGGLIFYFTSLSESFLPHYALLAGISSTFGGGFLAARKGRSRGLWHGLAVSLLYLAVLLIISALFIHPLHFNWDSFLYYTLAGALGGITGVGSA